MTAVSRTRTRTRTQASYQAATAAGFHGRLAGQQRQPVQQQQHDDYNLFKEKSTARIPKIIIW